MRQDLNWETCFTKRSVSVTVIPTCHGRGLGAEPPGAGGYRSLVALPPAAGRFFETFWKKSYFNTIGSHFERI